MNENQGADLVVDLWKAGLGGDKLFSDGAVADAETTGGTVSRWIQYAPRGVIPHPKFGELVFDDSTLAEMKTNFDNKVYGIDTCMDREHAVDGDTRALAWFKEMEVRDDGLWARAEFTKEGLEKVFNDKAYRYFSPQYGPVEKDGVTYNNVPKGGAATNKPFLKDMYALVATEAWLAPTPEGQVTLTSSTFNQGVPMPDKPAASPAAPATPVLADVQLSELKAENEKKDKLLSDMAIQLKELSDSNKAAEKRLTEANVEQQITKWSNMEVQLSEVKDADTGVVTPGKKVKVGITPAVAKMYRDFKLTETAIPVETFIDAMLSEPTVILSEIGTGLSQEGDRPDEADAAPRRAADDASNVLPITGQSTVRLAEEYAKAQGLDFTKADVKLTAFAAVEKMANTRRGQSANGY